MVNKNKAGVLMMVPLFLFVFYSSSAQHISKHYKSTLQANGMLYFIFPGISFENKTIKSSLTFDITYLSSKDTATVNFSYFDKLSRNLDSIVFIYNNNKFSAPVTKIFIETKRSKWHYRYIAKTTFSNLNNFFSQTNTVKILIWSGKDVIELNIRSGSWNKHSVEIQKIFSLIKLNK